MTTTVGKVGTYRSNGWCLIGLTKNSALRLLYLLANKTYKKLCIYKKTTLFPKNGFATGNCKDPREFWKNVRIFGKRTMSVVSSIGLDIMGSYFEKN